MWFNRYLDLMFITFMIYNNTFLQIKELKVFLIPTYVFKKSERTTLREPEVWKDEDFVSFEEDA